MVKTASSHSPLPIRTTTPGFKTQQTRMGDASVLHYLPQNHLDHHLDAVIASLTEPPPPDPHRRPRGYREIDLRGANYESPPPRPSLPRGATIRPGTSPPASGGALRAAAIDAALAEAWFSACAEAARAEILRSLREHDADAVRRSPIMEAVRAITPQARRVARVNRRIDRAVRLSLSRMEENWDSESESSHGSDASGGTTVYEEPLSYESPTLARGYDIPATA